MRIASFAAALLLAASTARAADPAAASLDRLLPADTFFYLSLDARALRDGVPKLDLAGLFREAEVRDFLRPILSQQPGLDGADPIASLMQQADLDSWIGGDVTLGICGVTIEIESADGARTRHAVSPSHPITARMLHELGGGFASFHHHARSSGAGVSVCLDFLLSLVPGPALKAQIDSLLPLVGRTDHVQIEGRDLTRMTIPIPDGPKVTLYGDLGESRWLIGGDPGRVVAALKGESHDSLAAQAAFASVKQRVASGQNVALAYVNFASLLAIGQALVPPIAREELGIWGLDSLQGLAYAMSLTEGSVRDSFLVMMDPKHQGLAQLVDAIGSGFPSLKSAPPSTLAFAGLRLDLAKLQQGLRDFADQMAPGSSAQLERALKGMSAQGAQLLDTVAAALGDEISAAFAPSTDGSPIPQVFTTLTLRDRTKFDQLVAMAKQLLGEHGQGDVESFPITGGDDGLVVKMRDAPVEPAFAVRANTLYGALLGPLALKTYLNKQVENPQRLTLASQNETLPKVLRGLTGGTLEPGALFYLDLRRAVPVIYQTAAPMISQMIKQSGIGLDTSRLPMAETLAPHFSGLALGITRGPTGVSFDAFTPLGLFPSAIGAMISQHVRFEMPAAEPVSPAVRKRRVVEAGVPSPQPAIEETR
jgi:hypothetical protein